LACGIKQKMCYVLKIISNFVANVLDITKMVLHLQWNRICKYKYRQNNFIGGNNITKNVIMEKFCTYFCIALGTVFLIMAFAIAWKYLFSCGICYATAVITTETREH
jgi:hypothetical protein